MSRKNEIPKKPKPNTMKVHTGGFNPSVVLVPIIVFILALRFLL